MRRLIESALAAAIGVMQQRIGLASAPDRHHQSVSDKLRRHCCTHRPTDHTSGERIDHGRNIEPTFRGPHVSEVSNPFAVGSGHIEAAVEHVRSDGGEARKARGAKLRFLEAEIRPFDRFSTNAWI